MSATDTDALTERIARALFEKYETDITWDATLDFPAMRSWYLDTAPAVLPIVAEEVRKAKAEAILMDGFDMAVADRLADAGYTEYAEDEDGGVTWVSAPLGEVLHIVRISATEYETGDRA